MEPKLYKVFTNIIFILMQVIKMSLYQNLYQFTRNFIDVFVGGSVGGAPEAWEIIKNLVGQSMERSNIFENFHSVWENFCI